jgi:lipoate synthase
MTPNSHQVVEFRLEVLRNQVETVCNAARCPLSSHGCMTIDPT